MRVFFSLDLLSLLLKNNHSSQLFMNHHRLNSKTPNILLQVWKTVLHNYFPNLHGHIVTTLSYGIFTRFHHQCPTANTSSYWTKHTGLYRPHLVNLALCSQSKPLFKHKTEFIWQPLRKINYCLSILTYRRVISFFLFKIAFQATFAALLKGSGQDSHTNLNFSRWLGW